MRLATALSFGPSCSLGRPESFTTAACVTALSEFCKALGPSCNLGRCRAVALRRCLCFAELFSVALLRGALSYDVKAAFYRVVRQLVVDTPDSDEGILRVVATLGLPPAALAELQTQLASLTALDQAGASTHLMALLSDAMQGTFFRLELDNLVYATKRGTRPGDPAADILFAFLLSGYFRKVEQVLQEAHLEEALPAFRSAPLTGACVPGGVLGFLSWADDCMRGVSAATVPQVLDKVTAVLSFTMEIATSLGIAFSCGPTKTCVMLPALRSPRARAAVSGTEAGGVPRELLVPNRLTQETVQVGVVAAYKHLGSVLTADMSPYAEVAYRHSQALSVSRPLGYRFFASGRYQLKVRRYLLRSLVISKFVHGSVSLCLSTGVLRRLWFRNYVALWRSLCPRDPGTRQYLHSYEVLAVADAAPPNLALALARATFLHKHAAQGPCPLLVLLQLEWEMAPMKSWLHQLADDVALVQDYVPAVATVLQTACPVRTLMGTFEEQPGWWLSCVRQAISCYRRDLGQWVARAGSVQCAVVPPTPTPDEPFQCPHCGATVSLRRYLCTHLAQRHQLVSPARHYAPTPWCASCLRSYSDVAAVQNHLRKNPACLRRSACVLPPMSHEEIQQAEMSHKTARRRVRRGDWQSYVRPSPVLRVFGPAGSLSSRCFHCRTPS